MITKDDIIALTQNSEFHTLEFKKQWYWDNQTSRNDKSSLWGELIKDIIALSNGYPGHAGKTRYLIIGFCEKDKKFYDINIAEIREFSSVRELKRTLLEKIRNYTNPIITKIEPHFIKIDGTDILCIEMQSPTYIVELSKDLETKTRTIDAGIVLVRKGVNSDSIKSATTQEITLLTEDFKRFAAAPSSDINPNRKKIRSIMQTIQQYLDKNRNNYLETGYPLVEKNWDENIIFEYYKISQPFGDGHCFLYVHENTSQGKTFGHLRSKGLVADSNSKLIVLTEEPEIIDPEKRKENLKTAFKTSHVYFIDEFGKQFLYGEYIIDYTKYNLPVYVNSLSDNKISGKSLAIEILKDWFLKPSTPLVVVKGHGGIGKTTLVKQFLDNIHETITDAGLLFIESNDIINEIDRLAKTNSKIDDIYDFYLAQTKTNQAKSGFIDKSFSRDLLQLSVDNGSVIIVLDGIDEVIAKLGSKFDVRSFIESISTKYASNLEKTKIIITCRDYFWDKISANENILQISLRPFIEELARDFFSQHFNQSSARIQKGMELANKFAIYEEDTVTPTTYIPYALDMIAFLIKQRADYIETTELSDENSSLLNMEISNDFLIYRFCHREIKKLNNLSVDSQLELLINIAISENSAVSLYDIKSLFQKNDVPRISNDVIEKLKGHPLLNCNDSDQTLHFRYDFFTVFFKSLLITKYFKDMDASRFSPSIIDVLSSYVKFDNSFTSNVAQRLNYSDEIVLFSIETIELIKKHHFADAYLAKRSISAIFSLLLSLLKRNTKGLPFNIETCTELLCQVFEYDSQLKDVYIIDLQGASSTKPTFNFSGKKITQSHFENYIYFWDCSFDESTQFTYTEFKNLDPRKGVRPKFYEFTFGEGCDTEDIGDLLTNAHEENLARVIDIREQLLRFFRLFYQSGNFYPRKQEHIKSKVFAGALLQPLLKERVIEAFVDPQKATMQQYRVSQNYRSVIAYIEQGSPSIELEKLIKLLQMKQGN